MPSPIDEPIPGGYFGLNNLSNSLSDSKALYLFGYFGSIVDGFCDDTPWNIFVYEMGGGGTWLRISGMLC